MSEDSPRRSKPVPTEADRFIESFVRDLRAAGYVRGTILQKQRIALSFVAWIRGKRVSVNVADEAHAAAFLGRRGKRSMSRRVNERAAVRGFLRHLRGLTGRTPKWMPPRPAPVAVTQRYADYLRNAGPRTYPEGRPGDRLRVNEREASRVA